MSKLYYAIMSFFKKDNVCVIKSSNRALIQALCQSNYSSLIKT